jgi:FdrA protein
LVRLEEDSRTLIPLAAAEQVKLVPGQYALRGLFAGGTFCYEAQLILKNLPEPVHSNAPLVKMNRMSDSHVSRGHVCIDLGEDEFTQGRLHPMIDPSLRNRRILQEARDPATAVILLDIVLGYGAHPDPAGATVEAICEAQGIAAAAGRHVVFIASVCGTEADPQPLSQQEARLCDAGVLVLPDNASAARLAGLVTQALHDG